jgi:hypothetical protein
MRQLFNTPRFKRITSVIGAIVALLVAFQGGVFVGFHKASMAFRVDERYQHAYGEHFHSGPLGIPDDDFPEAHGAIGKVISISLPTIVVEDKNAERVVRVATDTVVRKNHDKVDPASITANDFIVVIGAPNDSQEVIAKFIRILPPPPGFVPTTSASAGSSTTH